MVAKKRNPSTYRFWEHWDRLTVVIKMLHRRVVLSDYMLWRGHLSFMAFQWNDRPGVSTRPWSLPLTNYVLGTFNIDEFILHFFSFHHRGISLAYSQYDTNTHRTSLQICSEQVQQSHIQKNRRHGYIDTFIFAYTTLEL